LPPLMAFWTFFDQVWASVLTLFQYQIRKTTTMTTAMKPTIIRYSVGVWPFSPRASLVSALRVRSRVSASRVIMAICAPNTRSLSTCMVMTSPVSALLDLSICDGRRPHCLHRRDVHHHVG